MELLLGQITVSSIWFVFAFGVSVSGSFFFLEGPAPLALFMRHEQCKQANKQYFFPMNSNRKLFFYYF